jgi:hypothetical protein
MMLFAVLGWTLAVMQATDFEVNTRNLDFERALGLAESGAQWALQQLKTDSGWRTDPSHGYPGNYAQHSLGFGQYRLTCADGAGVEAGKIIITSSGYIPAYTNYRTMRQIRLVVTPGSFAYVIEAKGLLDWTQAAPFYVSIEGKILAANYDVNGNGTTEEGVDYSNTEPLLPPDKGSRQQGSVSFPEIKMDTATYGADSYESQAGSNVWDLAKTSTIQSLPGSDRVKTSLNIFIGADTNWENVTIIRNRTLDPGHSWNNEYWRVIVEKISSDTVRLESNVPASWQAGHSIEIVKRYRDNVTGDTLWYIKGSVLFDVRDTQAWEAQSIKGNITFKATSLVAEGDIVIKGPNKLDFSEKPVAYPSLATKEGDIISLDTPDGGNDSAKRGKRSFDNLIYTENGNVDFNYINGASIMGNNVTLRGSIDLKYDDDLLNLSGFVTGGFQITWQEQ